MASFINTVNKLANKIADQLDADQQLKDGESPSKGAKFSLEKAPREDLIEYIKKQTLHRTKVESRLTDLIAAYKQVLKEKADLETDYKDLNDKYKVLYDSKDESTSSASSATATADAEQKLEQDNNGELSATNFRGLEKLVAKLEREKEELARKLTEEQESASAQANDLEAEIEEYKQEVTQLTEKLDEKTRAAESIEEKIKQLNEKFGEEQERALQAEKERDEAKTHLEQANVLVATLQKECDDSKDTFNSYQLKAEEEKAGEGRKLEALQEDLQSTFQAERNLLKGEIQKLMQELASNQEKFKQEKGKLEEDLLNVELERRMLVDEIKGDGEVLYKKEWEEEKKKLNGELEEEKETVTKLREELTWERERKDTFDKRLEGIENRSESERNRTLEAEKRQLEITIKDLEVTSTENENKVRSLEEDMAACKQQLEEERQRLADELASEKSKWQDEAKKCKEEVEKLDSGLSANTKSLEEVGKIKEEMQQQIAQLETIVKELESEKSQLTEKLQHAEQERTDGEQFQEYLEKIGEEKNVLTAEMERLRELLEESKLERNETNAKLEAATRQLEESAHQFAEEKKSLRESVTINESELVQHKEGKSKLESEIDSLEEQLKEATQTVDQLVQQKAEMAVQLDKAKEIHEVEKSELARTTSAKILDLEGELSTLQATKVELEAEIDLMRKEALKNNQENALMLADKITEISVLEQKIKEGKESRREPDENHSLDGDAGKLRNDLSEKEAELFQLRQEMYAKDKAIVEGKALLEQSLLEQSQLREDIADKDEQIDHLKEEQEIQMKAVNTATPAAGDKELGEKLNKYRQLLLHAQNHINDLKKKLSDKQNDFFELQKKMVGFNEEIDKLKSDKTKYSEQNFNQLQKNYEQHCRTSKLRIDSLEQQLQSTSKDLNTLRTEYQSYKVRAASALKTAPANSSTYSTPLSSASDRQEQLIRSLGHEIDSLKASRLELEETKMHLYKLEMDNAQLTKQAKQSSDQAAEFEARLKIDSTRLSEEKQELSARLSAQKDDLQQQLNLLQHSHKSIVKEKEEQISVLEHQVKLLQDETKLKAGTIQKLAQQVTDQQLTPPTPRNSSSPRLAHFQTYYAGDTVVAEDDKKKNTNINATTTANNNNDDIDNYNNSNSLTRSMSNSSTGSAADESLRRSISTPRASASLDAGDQILFYAQLQALREEELAKAHNKLKEMGNALSEAERMEKLHNMQEQVLKQEIRELQRAQKRENTNPEYLKNVVVKYLEFDDQQEKLLPVISTLLQLTPVEVKRLEDKRKARNATLLSKVWG